MLLDFSSIIEVWLKKSKCDWKILIGHHTWESVGYHGHAEDLLDNMLSELFLHEPFDIYVCGHDLEH